MFCNIAGKSGHKALWPPESTNTSHENEETYEGCMVISHEGYVGLKSDMEVTKQRHHDDHLLAIHKYKPPKKGNSRASCPEGKRNGLNTTALLPRQPSIAKFTNSGSWKMSQKTKLNLHQRPFRKT